MSDPHSPVGLSPEMLVTVAALEALSATLDPSSDASRRAIAIILEATAFKDELGIPEDVAAMALKAAILWEATLS